MIGYTQRPYVPPRDWRLRANDILEAAERAQVYVEGLTFEHFAADSRNVDAVSYAMQAAEYVATTILYGRV